MKSSHFHSVNGLVGLLTCLHLYPTMVFSVMDNVNKC